MPSNRTTYLDLTPLKQAVVPLAVAATALDFPLGWTPEGRRFMPAMEIDGVVWYQRNAFCATVADAQAIAQVWIDAAVHASLDLPPTGWVRHV